MRVLVLDQSRILLYLVRRVAPAGVEVDGALGFEQAERMLRERPPDAAVVSLPPAHLPWREFQRLCASLDPPVPVLYESCLFSDALAAGLDPADGYAAFLAKPAPPEQLSRALLKLVEEARRARGAARSSSPQ